MAKRTQICFLCERRIPRLTDDKRHQTMPEHSPNGPVTTALRKALRLYKPCGLSGWGVGYMEISTEEERGGND